MNYSLTSPQPQIAALSYSDSASDWVITIAQVLWDEILEAPETLSHFASHEPGYIPRSWELPGGWNRYDVQDDRWVECSESDLPKVMTLDVESQRESEDGEYRPVLAIAMGADEWYGWRWDGVGLPESIPFPDGRIVIGHDVRRHDAKYLSCEYDLNAERTLFICTRELARIHRGITDEQTAFYKQCSKHAHGSKGVPAWYDHSLMLSLDELSVRVLGKPIDKSVRQSLEKWDMAGMVSHLRGKLPLAVQEKLDQNILTYGELVTEASQVLATFTPLAPTSLAAYCGQDVHATYQLFQHYWGLCSRQLMPHLVSWTGQHEISNIRILTTPIAQQRDSEIEALETIRGEAIAELQLMAFDATPETRPDLDWSEYKSGANKGQVKWRVQCEKDEWSPGCRSVVDLLELTWDDEPVRWGNRQYETEKGALPHWNDSTKPLKISPINEHYLGHVLTMRLQSRLLGNRFLDWFHSAVIGWGSISSYDDAYAIDTDLGLISVGGVMPIGKLHHGANGLGCLSERLLEGFSLVTASTKARRVHGANTMFRPDGFRFGDDCIDTLIAEWLASTVAGRPMRLEGDRHSFGVLVRGGSTSALQVMGRNIVEMPSQVEACLEDLAHRSYGRSPVLGWRMSEAIDPQWAVMLDPSVRREWLIDSARTDLIHTFLTVMRAFVIEYELTVQLYSVRHDSLAFRWMVMNKDIEQFQACVAKAWEMSIKACGEWMAQNMNQSGEMGAIPVGAQDTGLSELKQVVHGGV